MNWALEMMRNQGYVGFWHEVATNPLLAPSGLLDRP
jgi:hypothetical protein